MKGAWAWLWSAAYRRRVELLACSIELTGLQLAFLTDLAILAMVYAVTGLLLSEILGSGGSLRRWVDS